VPLVVDRSYSCPVVTVANSPSIFLTHDTNFTGATLLRSVKLGKDISLTPVGRN